MKLESVWGQEGKVYELKDDGRILMKESSPFEAQDLTGKRYIYSKMSSSGEGNQTCGNRLCLNRNSRFCKPCQCRKISYCSIDCLKTDRDTHRKMCETEIQHQN